MKMKSVVLLALALGCGLFAMLAVKKVMSHEKPVEEEYGQVLIALSDIAPGVPLNETNVAFKKWPLEAIPPGAVVKPEQYADRSLRVAAVTNDMILDAKLNEPGVFGASCEIPAGMRVVTVSVDATKTHSGLIQPGDRVDLLVTYKVRAERGMVSKTKTVLEYIKVFATDSRRASGVAEQEDHQAKNISLLVDPDQANLLMLAENLGTLHPALRNENDTEAAEAADVDGTIFEDAEATLGRPDQIAESGGEGRKLSDSVSVQEALRREMQGPQGPTEPVSTTEPEAEPLPEEKPKWKINIYAGGEHRIEEVEMPSLETAQISLPQADVNFLEKAVGADMPKVWVP